MGYGEDIGDSERGHIEDTATQSAEVDSEHGDGSVSIGAEALDGMQDSGFCAWLVPRIEVGRMEGAAGPVAQVDWCVIEGVEEIVFGLVEVDRRVVGFCAICVTPMATLQACWLIEGICSASGYMASFRRSLRCRLTPNLLHVRTRDLLVGFGGSSMAMSARLEYEVSS